MEFVPGALIQLPNATLTDVISQRHNTTDTLTGDLAIMLDSLDAFALAFPLTNRSVSAF